MEPRTSNSFWHGYVVAGVLEGSLCSGKAFMAIGKGEGHGVCPKFQSMWTRTAWLGYRSLTSLSTGEDCTCI